MKNLNISNIFPGVAILLLTACVSDNPDIPVNAGNDAASAESRIEIFAGLPSSGGSSTRTIEEPGRPGVCDANRCALWFYQGAKHTSSLSTPSFNASDVHYLKGITVEANRYGDDYAQNKLASCLYDFEALSRTGTLYHYTATAISSLAYTDSDADKFVVDPQGEGDTPDHLTLSLTGTDTPELYFGKLELKVFEGDDKVNSVMHKAHDDIYYYYYYHANNTPKPLLSNPVTGRLYRLVSQMNITMQNVPERGIDKLELYISDFPDKVTLFGNHGYFYPVSVASTHISDGDNYIKVSECTHFHKGEARLSTFLLPSDLGYKMRMRVWFTPGTVYDNDGNEILYKDCTIRPDKSVFMHGNDAEVYFDGAASHLKHESDLFVYNDTEQRFYSYANVRINLGGDFDKVLREESPVDVKIEICPAFQKDHTWDL